MESDPLAVASGCGSTKKTTGRRGNGIAYFKVLPNKLTLRQGTVTTIQLKSNLSFVVGVVNDGDQPVQDVKVTLVIHQHAPAPPITKTLTIPQIATGATQEVNFRGPFTINTMISVVPITVDVHPVPGETNTANNKAMYDVRFSF